MFRFLANPVSIGKFSKEYCTEGNLPTLIGLNLLALPSQVTGIHPKNKLKKYMDNIMPYIAYTLNEVYAFTYDDKTINSLHKVLYPMLNSHNLVNTFFL